MPSLRRFAFSILVLSASTVAFAQTDTPDKQQAQQDQDSAAVAKASADETPTERLARCWNMIIDSRNDTKNIDKATQAMNALSEMPTNPRALELIAAAMKDPNIDIRTAAVLAAGKTKSATLVPPLRKLLDDPEPGVVFVAATTLWKVFKDHTGEDILATVVAGDRKANPSLMHGAENDASHTMHSPSAMTKIGITTGAGLLLGPFGYGVTAIEYMRKNGDSARVEAMNLLAEEKTPAVREELVKALSDKDTGVRAAAAKNLGDYHSAAYALKLAPLVDDPKLPVRLSAAAAYINSLSGSAPSKHAKK
jgi:HEAT repeat protein